MIKYTILCIFTKRITNKQHNLKYKRHKGNDTPDNKCTRIDQVDDDGFGTKTGCQKDRVNFGRAEQNSQPSHYSSNVLRTYLSFVYTAYTGLFRVYTAVSGADRHIEYGSEL